jgi:hypothetical protein
MSASTSATAAQGQVATSTSATAEQGQVATLIAFLLVSINQLSSVGLGSTRHIRRLVDAGKMPAPVRLGKLLRWRMKTGDPTTGVRDWVDAGCPSCERRGK